MWFILIVLVLLAVGPLGADGAAVSRGLLLGVVAGLLTSWGWVYSRGWNARVEAEKDETVERAEARAEQARR